MFGHLVMDFEFSILGNHDSSALFDPKDLMLLLSRRSFGPRQQKKDTGRQGPSLQDAIMEYLCKMPRFVQNADSLFTDHQGSHK